MDKSNESVKNVESKVKSYLYANHTVVCQGKFERGLNVWRGKVFES